jgi:hypothetical protein
VDTKLFFEFIPHNIGRTRAGLTLHLSFVDVFESVLENDARMSPVSLFNTQWCEGVCYIVPAEITKFLHEIFTAFVTHGFKTLSHMLLQVCGGTFKVKLSLNTKRKVRVTDSLPKYLLADFGTFKELH